jgi:hypothetical protein
MWWLIILTLATGQLDSIRFERQQDCLAARDRLDREQQAASCIYFPFAPLT